MEVINLKKGYPDLRGVGELQKVRRWCERTEAKGKRDFI